jgi:hypothetical protein
MAAGELTIVANRGYYDGDQILACQKRHHRARAQARHLARPGERAMDQG